jgi:putative toxin-antitoxin system antitoxin component (TIGR02293 family)
MYVAVVEPNKVARVLGLRRKVTTVEQLEQQVEAGLPKASLGAVARHVYGTSSDAAALMQRVIPSATFHRRGEDLKPQEGQRVERLARVIATAEQVWDSVDDARAFLSTRPRHAEWQAADRGGADGTGCSPRGEPALVAVPWRRRLRTRPGQGQRRQPGSRHQRKLGSLGALPMAASTHSAP